MFRGAGFLILLVFSFCSQGFADTIYLKDGQRIDGKIIEENNYSVKAMVDNRPQIFYMGQIDHVVTDEERNKVEISSSEFPDISKEKVDLIMTLLKSSGMSDNLQKSAEQAVQKAPAERKEEFEKIFEYGQLIKVLIPIYDVHYTDNDLKELIKIYEMPVRQKEIEQSPGIMKEAIETLIKHIYENAKRENSPDVK